MFKGKFKDIVLPDDGFLRGPFGSTLKKSLFVPKTKNTYKVYEQSVVLEKNKDLGNYYISEEYFNSELKRFEVKKGDFLVSCSGVNYGEIFQLDGEVEKGVINQALLRIRLNTKIVDQNYFLYYFKSYIVKVITGGTGDSTIPNFPPMSFIKNIDIELPDMKEQIMIGNILKNVDNKISNNKKINIELEKLAETVYNYWFLQFEFLDYNNKPYKSSNGKMIWSEKLKKEIPFNWEVKKLSSLLEKIPFTDKINSSEYRKYGKYPIIDQSQNYINGYTDEENSILKLKDAIIFGDHTKIVKYVNFDFARGADGTKVINSNNSNISNYLLYMQIKEMSLVTQGYSRYFKFLKDKYILVPDIATNNKYSKIVDEINFVIKNNLLENYKLIELRNYLLPLIISGQIGFKD